MSENPTPPDVAKEHPLPWSAVAAGKTGRAFVEDANGFVVIETAIDQRKAEYIVAAVNATQATDDDDVDQFLSEPSWQNCFCAAASAKD